MILTAIKYKVQFLYGFEEINIKDGYGGHGIGVGTWKEFKPIFKDKITYFTKRVMANNIQLILIAMSDKLIQIDKIELIIKNDR